VASVSWEPGENVELVFGDMFEWLIKYAQSPLTQGRI